VSTIQTWTIGGVGWMWPRSQTPFTVTPTRRKLLSKHRFVWTCQPGRNPLSAGRWSRLAPRPSMYIAASSTGRSPVLRNTSDSGNWGSSVWLSTMRGVWIQCWYVPGCCPSKIHT
jgi:hypothetical protein